MNNLESTSSANSKTFSVLLCTYNAEQYIVQTIRSILDQTYTDFDVHIFDNNSTDDTRDLIAHLATKDRRIKCYYSGVNFGPYAVYNYLMRKTNSEFIAIQDHDDIWHPQKLEIQHKILNKHPTIVACGSNQVNYYERSEKYKVPPFFAGKFAETVPHTSLVFRNKFFYYPVKVSYKTDQVFMRYILNTTDNLMYKIGFPLVLHRHRADSANMNNIWFNFPAVLSYLRVDGSIKTIIIFLLKRFLLLFITYDQYSLITTQGKIFNRCELSKNSYLFIYERYIKNVVL